MYNNTKSQNDDDLSMDEILASIRRYVVDEQQSTQTTTTHQPHHQFSHVEEERVQRSSMSDFAGNQSAHTQPVPVVRLTAAHEVKESSSSKNNDSTSSSDSPASILSPSAMDSAAQSLHRLKNTVKIDQQDTPAASQSVEHFIVSLIKPLVKRWLDENLPSIVERMVQKEIQKITNNID